MILKMHIPFLPPSENRIRVHRRQGGQVYSKEARDFVTRFSAHVRQEYFTQVAAFVKEHTEWSAYSVTMTFTLPTLVNKGWLKNQAKTLYKKVDVGNRRKLIEDCLVQVLGDIDDSVFFEVLLRKRMGSIEGVWITVEEVNSQDFGVPDDYFE
jgi:Holliday junction resolvase RusA-like endonuclease